MAFVGLLESVAIAKAFARENGYEVGHGLVYRKSIYCLDCNYVLYIYMFCIYVLYIYILALALSRPL